MAESEWNAVNLGKIPSATALESDARKSTANSHLRGESAERCNKYIWRGGLNSGVDRPSSAYGRLSMHGLDARGAGSQRMTPARDPMRLGSIHDRMVKVNIDRGDLRTFCDATGQSLENI